VAELSEHVAEVRGAPFPEPVTVELLEDDAFDERLLEDVEEGREDIDLVGRLLVALHLLDPSDDLYEIYREFLGVGVIGFYDPETGELVVRGAALTTATRSTIVHELTHAYDDQRFELHRPDVQDADDETALGFSRSSRATPCGSSSGGRRRSAATSSTSCWPSSWPTCATSTSAPSRRCCSSS
jgi:hypothetical protein